MFNLLKFFNEMKMVEIKKVLKWLILFNLIFVALYLISNHIFFVPSHTIRRWFDLDAEANIPTWFSGIQLFSLFALSIIYSKHIEDNHLRRFYFLMGYVFLFFSVDEISRIHEGITSIFNELGIRSFFPGDHGMWILLYPTILILLILIFWKGFLAFLNENNARAIFIVGAVVFVVGGVGFEVFGYFLDKGTKSIFYIIEVTAEESFELLGQSLMIYALLSKIYFMPENTYEGSKTN